ncbi:pimeloyl-ACP methyl ester carboxylesterase [Flavobacterium sp. 1]|uniref:alpha/beta hydrolase n=1 Tax=Flavobacterium sp. 1 TaxID=2035200 RepID=UPI000CB9F4EF|nr:alpha/beta hydrolase [Flavobacterium sp. 1]PJJ09215.1 pimeloyl-ACP methyl ester carboxylesterase [Flavobacterium sp. 1]
MKNLSSTLSLVLLHLFLATSVFAKSPIHTVIVHPFNDSIVKKQVSEESFVSINGIEQWITIKGESSKPVILFIHGGPGSPISPYSDNLYKDLSKDFIIVQWDQRGTGKTFGRTAPEELTPEFLQANPLTLEQMTADGIAVSEYLLKHLGKQKIILFGTSWGSALGVKIATKRPDLFYAYVGHSQIVNPVIDETFYNKIYKIAQDKNDKVSLEVLNAIGKPPYDRAKKVGQLFRVLKKYESANSVPAPESWFVESPAYNNPKDSQNREEGDDYSFVNYTGDSKLGVQSMSAAIDLMRDNFEFKIPVYLIQGNEDLLTPKEASKAYFDKIKAPEKKYYLLPKTAHGFNASVLEAQTKIFKSIKTL